jgi:uncharacterized membrane protein YgdD (TMEM256/DUF423 family)
MQRLWIGIGALAGFAAVVMAAVSAHALPDRLDPAAMTMAHSANEMLGWHALALLACGLWAGRGGKLADAAGAVFTVGLILFCGSVYALALTGLRLGPLAPIGGTLLMLGWLLLGLSAIRAR